MKQCKRGDSRRVAVVRVVCQCCGGITEPVALDGQYKVCGACGQPLFTYSGPKLSMLMEQAGMEPLRDAVPDYEETDEEIVNRRLGIEDA